MDRFVVRKSDTENTAVRDLVHHLQVVLAQKGTRQTPTGTSKPWKKWDDKQREEAASLYRSAGKRACILKYGVDGCPHVSIMREWGTKLFVQGCIKPVGRPTKLTSVEDAALEQFFNKMREEGGVADREGIVVMAYEVIRKKPS